MEAEHRRLPLFGGSMAQRKHKADIERQMDRLGEDVSALRMQLKQMHAL